MGRLIMWNLITLDGCFEGAKSWDLGWHEYFWGDELERFSIEQLEGAGALLFGRVTYQGMAAHWTTAQGTIADFMNSLPKVVFSRTLQTIEWNNTRLVRERAEEEVAALKRRSAKDLFVFGSANLSAALSRHGLFDEYRLCLVPVVLGVGAPLFKAGTETMRMTLLEARPLTTGAVILRYEPGGR